MAGLGQTPPGFSYPTGESEPGVGSMVGGFVMDPLLLYPVGTGLATGRGMTAKLFGITGGVKFKRADLEARVGQLVRGQVGANKYDPLFSAAKQRVLASSKYKGMDIGKMNPSQQVKIQRDINIRASKEVQANLIKNKALNSGDQRRFTRQVGRSMGRENLKALKMSSKAGAGFSRARMLGQVGRGLRMASGAMIVASLAAPVLSSIKEAAIIGRNARGSDDLNPYTNLGQSREAYTQRMEAAQSLQRIPGFLQRMGTEARMYHT